MDRTAQHRQAIQTVLQRHLEIAEQNSSRANGETYTLVDSTAKNYFLLTTEFREQQQAYGVLVHLHLEDDKIQIKVNNVQDFIEDLIDLGIPETDFVVADRETARTEILPIIHRLTDAEKQQLIEVLAKELSSAPERQSGMNGPQLLEAIEKRFADCPGFELPEVPREPIRTDLSLFGE